MGEIEVIIIDNGSTDGTYEFLQERVKEIETETFCLLQCLTPGSYAARNEGLRVASGDYVAFTDSDCLVSSDWLTSLLECWNEQQDDILVAVMKIRGTLVKTPPSCSEMTAPAYRTMRFSNEEHIPQGGLRCLPRR